MLNKRLYTVLYTHVRYLHTKNTTKKIIEKARNHRKCVQTCVPIVSRTFFDCIGRHRSIRTSYDVTQCGEHSAYVHKNKTTHSTYANTTHRPTTLSSMGKSRWSWYWWVGCQNLCLHFSFVSISHITKFYFRPPVSIQTHAPCLAIDFCVRSGLEHRRQRLNGSRWFEAVHHNLRRRRRRRSTKSTARKTTNRDWLLPRSTPSSWHSTNHAEKTLFGRSRVVAPLYYCHQSGRGGLRVFEASLFFFLLIFCRAVLNSGEDRRQCGDPCWRAKIGI